MITSYFFKNSFVHKNFAFLVAVLLGLSFLIFSNSTKLSNLTNSVSPLSSKTTIEAEKEKAIKAYGKLPIYFVPNKGQLNSKVKYYAAGAGYSFYLTQDGVTYSFTKNNPNDAKNLLTPETNKDIDKSKKIEGYALKIKFLGTNQNTILESQKEQKGKVNYLIGNDSKKWQTNLSIFSQITYKNLYSGIDLTYKSDQKKIKYEFTVSPKANYKEVKFLYKGANSLRLDKKGNLLINTPWGKLKDEKPYVYQLVNGEKVSVDAGFTIKDDAVGFSLGNYNPNLPLVIDPGLLYSTFLGGSDIDYGFGIALDVLGNAYVIGNTQSSNFPTTVGAFDATHDYGCNIFVTKLNPQGSDLLYSTFLGGSDIDYGFGITLDASDNAYVTGYTSSSNFPTTAGAFDATHNGGYDDAFVAKLNPQGSGLLYSTFLGGSSGEESMDISLDTSGNAYVTGWTMSSNFPTTAGAFDATHNGGYHDVFVAKLNPQGSDLIYSTFLGGSSGDYGYGIALDTSGNAYVTGWTASSNFPTTAEAFDIIGDYDDAFVANLNSQGSGLLYSTLLGGSNFDYGHGITLDTSGNAYVIGNTGSSDFPTTAVAFDITSGHGVFVTKLNSQGSGLLYSTFLSGSSGDYGWDIALDTSGNAYVVGNTQSSDFPITAEAFDVTFNGGLDDVFVTKLATTDTISPTPSKIVGWGGYNNASFFNFNIFSNNKYPVGIFYYSDRTIGSLWSNQITRLTVSFDKKKAIFNGNIKIGGIAGYKFIVYVDDNGNPGTNDKFKIIIYDPINILVYTSNGTLFTGNIQIYP